MGSIYAVETKDLTKIYKQSVAAVSDFNINIESGRIYGLLGRNGAGKTTLMKMLVGLVYPTSGEFTIFGNKYDNMVSKKIGAIIENNGFYGNLTGRKKSELIASLRGIKTIDKSIIEEFNLSEVIDRNYKEYSMGMKQSLRLVASILHEPKLLILDEPCNALDPINIKNTNSYLEKISSNKGITIVVSSHILSEIEDIADEIIVMDNGKLIENVDMQTLRKKLERFTEIAVSDINSSAEVLRSININDFQIIEDRIQIKERIEDLSVVKKID